MPGISPTTSSPSIYSRAAHSTPSQTAHIAGLRVESDVSEDDAEERRMSMIAGPKLRKYAIDLPWSEESEWSKSTATDMSLVAGLSRQATRMMRSTAAKVGDAGMSRKKLLASSSGGSLASTQTTSTSSTESRPNPVTPKFRSALSENVELHAPLHSEGLLLPDRPLVSSGSPGFGLISLEIAQERERLRNTPCQGPTDIMMRPANTPSALHRIKGKKSGIMKLFNKSSASQPLFGGRRSWLEQESSLDSGDNAARVGNMWSDATADWASSADQSPAKPQLELRPVSMTFTRGLPTSYLCQSPSSPQGSPPPVSLRPSGATGQLAKQLKEQIDNARKAWRVQLFELEAQVRELRDELNEARQASAVGTCNACGCTCQDTSHHGMMSGEAGGRGVMNRGRVKTAGARGVFGSGSLYEWE
ncbi:hypothetical protein BCR39DRAFT_365346 [Naematelia encephala]|uniref:Uncharacterized protein n=1 Tax=Naematelia encephala TaxID=71784 RepID=A0A1Y2AKD8_9TREE|nr:hypothetical protein BCR39DRAFT_365346 [Naematelia encephala]